MASVNHEELRLKNLATLDADTLGLDMFDEADAKLMDDITEAKRRLQQYQQYIKAIFKDDDTVCFVAIVNETGQVVNEFLRAEDALLPEYYHSLQVTNGTASIYVGMNAYKPELVGQAVGRTQDNVAAIRTLYADADENGATTLEQMSSSSVVPQPPIVLESSPGKFQAIWPVRDVDLGDAKGLLQEIARRFGTDPAVADTARILRVPGLRNRKYPEAPEVKVVRHSDMSYRREDFKLAVMQTFNEKTPAPRDSNNQIPHGSMHPALVQEAGTLRNRGYTAEAIERALVDWAEINCASPVDFDKVKKIARSAENWPLGRALGGTLLMSGQATFATASAPVDVSDWRSKFRSVSEMEDGPVVMVIEGVLQEGTCFIGANPGDGKTLVALAFAKAIASGEPLFGQPQYPVNQARTVIYLIPESRDRAFRRRCEAFRMPDDKMKFMARTISAGASLELNDPSLLEAVRQTKPVVFLDTASRFMKGSDENAAAQNRQLVNDVITLLAAGAATVVLVHHATKAAKTKQEKMTLENMLRGSGDLGAMCDQAYGIRKDMNLYANGSGPMEIDMVSLKDREQIGGLTSIRLAASYKKEGSVLTVSCINEEGNFRVVSEVENMRRNDQLLAAIVKADLTIPESEIAAQTGLSEYAVKKSLRGQGWHRVPGGKSGASPWHQDNGQPCPYAKSALKPTHVG